MNAAEYVVISTNLYCQNCHIEKNIQKQIFVDKTVQKEKS